MKKQILFGTVFSLAWGVLGVACGGDETSTQVQEVVNTVTEVDSVVINDKVYYKDSVDFWDSLYSWYLDNVAKDDLPVIQESSSSKGSDSSSSYDDDEPESSSSEEENVSLEPVLLPPAGFYSQLTLPVPAAMEGGVIRCTQDGSSPEEWNSLAFVEPIEISGNTVLRCAEFVDGEPHRMSTQTYFVGETVNMPVVAISVNDHDMFDPTEGYYSQGVRACREPCYEANYWKDIELPVHVEFFENGSRSAGKAWEIDAGLSIMGAWSRYNEKKSVAISMRSIYQEGRLKYPIFKTRPKDKKFKGFNLRNNGNRFVGDYIEDAMLSSLLEGSGVDYQRSRQVVVFYNGRYFGIHDLRERLNEHFVETNYKIDSKEVDMVKHVHDTLSVSGGSADGYRKLLDFVATSDFSGANNKAYATASEMMDMGNYADYMAAELYYHNGDWPDNNVRAWRAPGQPFKFAIFDLDHGFGWDWAVDYFHYVDENMFYWVRRGGHTGCNTPGCFANLYVKLSVNPDFRRMFANHGAVMLDHYLTYDRVVEATNAMTASIPENEVKRDQVLYAEGRRMNHSFDATGATLIAYAKGRSEIVRDEYRAEFELGDDIKVTIASEGSGKVLLDGMTLPSADYTGTFFAGNDMLLEAVSTSGAVFAEWEDGSTKNPRLVSPKNGSSYKAVFK